MVLLSSRETVHHVRVQVCLLLEKLSYISYNIVIGSLLLMGDLGKCFGVLIALDSIIARFVARFPPCQLSLLFKGLQIGCPQGFCFDMILITQIYRTIKQNLYASYITFLLIVTFKYNSRRFYSLNIYIFI